MNDIPSTTATSQFFSVAVELGFISSEKSSELLPEALKSTQETSEFVLNSGALNATQVDVVKTLCAPDEVIPGYRIEALLGQGGMGVVYRAEQLNLHRQVAIKTILVSRMGDQNALHRFEREAQTIGQLRHPNIIAAFDFGRHAGRFYLALELVDGEDLSVRIKKNGPFDEATSLGLMRQAAAGLSHAATNHVVHRDIKPANLILVEPPEGYPLPPGMPMVKIADFGLALLQSEVDDSTRLTQETTLGSPHYMAPEQFESSDVDFRADMYSLGATLVETLTGKPPFHGMKLSQLIAAKFAKDENAFKNLPGSCTPATIDLVKRLMSVKPEKRPESYEELIQKIDRAIAGVQDITGTILLDPVQNSGAISGDSTKEFPLTSPFVPESSTEVGLEKHRTRFSLRYLLIAGAVAMISAALYFAINRSTNVHSLPVSPVRSPDAHVIGQSHQLFNGVDTNGWTIGQGSWRWVWEEAVLEGMGVIRRPIPRSFESTSNKPQAILWYQLDLIFHPLPAIQTNEEIAQELHFGIKRENQLSEFILRRNGTEVALLRRNFENNTTEQVSDVQPLSISREDLIAITLDRLPSGWFLKVNGEPFAAVSRGQSNELPEVQLQAIGGPVYFSDAMLTELSVE